MVQGEQQPIRGDRALPRRASSRWVGTGRRRALKRGYNDYHRPFVLVAAAGDYAVAVNHQVPRIVVAVFFFFKV